MSRRHRSLSHRFDSMIGSDLGILSSGSQRKRELAFTLSDCIIRKLDVLVERLLNRVLRNIADDLLLHFAVFKDQ